MQHVAEDERGGDHGIKVPELLFLKVSNEIQLETDLTFTRQ